MARFISAASRFTVDNLTTKVKDRLANKQDKRVYVKADMRARFGSVVQVVDAFGPPGSMILACLPIRGKQLQAPRQLRLRQQGNRGERPWEWQLARAEAKMQT